MEITVRLTPRASRSEVKGSKDGVLLVRVTSPPVDGKANRALCKLLAKRLQVAPSRVSVVRGEKSRDKVVSIEGLDRAALEAALACDG